MSVGRVYCDQCQCLHDYDKACPKQAAASSFTAPALLACAEFHENVGTCLLMGAMTLPNKKGILADAKARSMKHYEWAKEIRKLIGHEEPWLRKTIDDAKREYKKRPAWAKAG